MNAPMRPLLHSSQIDAAVLCLKQGGLVAMPTETVYGLAGDASSEAAVRKIFDIKGRPANHPLIVHIANMDQLSHWAKDIPPYALSLARHFWPGPITLILKKQPTVLKTITGGQETVGIRIPNHPVAQQLLKAFGGGLAAPSANRFGYISPTTAEHVHQDLGKSVEMILDGGHCSIGIESTIVDCTGDLPKILRPGMITCDAIMAVFSSSMSRQENNAMETSTENSQSQTLRFSGNLPSHYAPRTKTKLVSIEEVATLREHKHIVILSRRKPPHYHVKLYDSRIPHQKAQPNSEGISWVLMPSDYHGYAHRLYEQLHFADQLGCDEIWVESVPNLPEWQGIQDRLQKASAEK